MVFNNYYSLSRKRKVPIGRGKGSISSSVDSTGKCTQDQSEHYYLTFYTSEPIIVTTVKVEPIEIDGLEFDLLGLPSTSRLIDAIETKITGLTTLETARIVKQLSDMISSWLVESETGVITTHNANLNIYLNRLAETINQLNHTYKVYRLGIDGRHKLDPADTDRDHCQVTVITSQCLKRYTDTADKIRSKIRSSYDTLTSIYRGNATMKYLVDGVFQLIWRRYFYAKYVWPFAEISYGYAMTTYKSQGSTYHNVYVHLPNLLGCHKVEDLIKPNHCTRPPPELPIRSTCIIKRLACTRWCRRPALFVAKSAASADWATNFHQLTAPSTKAVPTSY